MTETKSKLAKAGTDTGSTEKQVEALTGRIAEITEHLQTKKKYFWARRGLLVRVGRRKRLLKYLARTDAPSYLALIKKLGLRR